MFRKSQIATAVVYTAISLLLVVSASNASLNVKVGDQKNIAVDSVLVNVTEEPTGDTQLQAELVQYLGQSGEPQIPWKVFTVLLPPDADLQSVSCGIDSLAYKSIKGKHFIKPQPPAATWDENGGTKTVWPEGKRIVDGRDVDIYRTNEFWPQECVRMLRVGKLRDWRVAEIGIALARCNPQKGELEVMSQAEIAIDFKRLNNAAGENSGTGTGRAKKLVCNFEQFADEYDMVVTGEDSTGYTIITT